MSSKSAEVGLRPLTADDDELIDRLWQLYAHDLSENRGSLPNADGLYKTGHLGWYRTDRAKWLGFLVTHQGTPAGFAFVCLAWDGDKRTIGDFFVVRSMRRRGVGFQVARELIGRFSGRWEIAFQAENRGAPEFWRRVVTSLVGDAWTEELRPVPDKPHIPPDHWLAFTTAG